MTPIREAIVLPLLFLTVALLGGLRVSDTVVLLVPSLASVALGVLLVGALVRGGALRTGVVAERRTRPLENVSGALVLASLVAARRRRSSTSSRRRRASSTCCSPPSSSSSS